MIPSDSRGSERVCSRCVSDGDRDDAPRTRPPKIVVERAESFHVGALGWSRSKSLGARDLFHAVASIACVWNGWLHEV